MQREIVILQYPIKKENICVRIIYPYLEMQSRLSRQVQLIALDRN